MRAPFQILAIPYRRQGGEVRYCVFHRSDHDQWQFIAGGGEDGETPEEAARREIWEESGWNAEAITRLCSVCSIPTEIFSETHLRNWPPDTWVIPEYSFGFECREAIRLSHEHLEYVWLPYEEARKKLKWDSNRTALYELNCRLTKAK
jgi:dATP pyrophosphohydrolase